MSDYAATLTSPKWQKKRLEIFQRDLFKCRECGNTRETLHVHHIRYKPNTAPWDYPDSNFLTLCWKCHEKKSPKKFPRKSKDQLARERARKSLGPYPHREDKNTWPF